MHQKILHSIFSVFFLLAANSFDAFAQGKVYKTAIEDLTVHQQNLFLKAQQTLDDWSGEYEKLVLAGSIIESLAKTIPDFLPIHIEKSRLIIMTGATGNNDFTKANNEALKILLDLQKKAPSYATPYILAGHVYTNIGNYSNAESNLAKAVSLKSTDPWLYNNLAQLKALQGKQAEVKYYAKKALLLSGGNSKALLAAIDFFSKSKNGVARTEQILEIVFSSYSSPRERFRIAERLIESYRGTPEPLIYADAIIDRQNAETPNLPEIPLLQAKLTLARGFLAVRNHSPRYDEISLRLAEELLATVISNPSVKTQAVKLMIDINLSKNDFSAARQLVANAEMEGPLDSGFQYAKAIIEYKAGDRAKAIAILEKLADSDPGYATNELILTSYLENGDIEKANKYYKNLIQKNPLDAWTLGNYSQFLLLFVDDVDGAINFGNQALRQMEYPMARNTTGLAYLIKASIKYREGKESAAQELYDAAKSLRYSNDYVRKYCRKYCEQIDQTIKNLKPGVMGVEGRQGFRTRTA